MEKEGIEIMADILYTYKNQVYANITNHCDCSCEFCIRTHRDSVGESDSLWFKKEPTLEEIKAANALLDDMEKAMLVLNEDGNLEEF